MYFLGESINKTNSLDIWFFSEATRYIPGNIWSFASRVYLSRNKRLSQKTSFLVVPLEIVIVIIATTLLSSYAIIKNLEKLPANLTIFVLTILVFALVLGLFLLQKNIKAIFTKLFVQELGRGAIAIALVLQIVSWSFYSAGTIVLITNFSMVALPLLFSATLLAWLIGYLSIVTPMGLGVRESAFILLVGSQIGTVQALLAAVLARIVLIVAELANLAFWTSIKKIR